MSITQINVHFMLSLLKGSGSLGDPEKPLTGPERNQQFRERHLGGLEVLGVWEVGRGQLWKARFGRVLGSRSLKRPWSP